MSRQIQKREYQYMDEPAGGERLPHKKIEARGKRVKLDPTENPDEGDEDDDEEEEFDLADI